jgi:uncharacterized RDD family membrane protein YckC
MQATFKKRALAYLIDLVLLGILVTLTLVIFPNNKEKINETNKDINVLTESYINDKINTGEYLKKYSKYNYKVEKLEIKTNIFNAIYMIFLYIIVPFISRGQTIGKILTKTKVVNLDGSDIKLYNIILRALIINFLIFPLITIPIIYFVKYNIYFIISIFLTFIEFFIVIFTIFMVLYRQDKKGLHDILTKTKVIKI